MWVVVEANRLFKISSESRTWSCAKWGPLRWDICIRMTSRHFPSIRSLSSRFWHIKLQGTIPISGMPFFWNSAEFQVPFFSVFFQFLQRGKTNARLRMYITGLNKPDWKVFYYRFFCFSNDLRANAAERNHISRKHWEKFLA